MKKIDLNEIRLQNIRAILDVLRQDGAITRQNIAERTGLSLMSVTNIVDQLLRNRVIEVLSAPAQKGKKQVGRKADVVRLDVRDELWMVIMLTDRHFRFATLYADRSAGFNSQPWPFRREKTYEENLRAFLQECAVYIRERAPHIIGVAVVVPGPYDPDTDCVSNMRIPELNVICLKKTLGELLGGLFVYVDEDVKFATRAYAEFYSDAPSLYYLYIGVGIGGALAQEGRIFRSLNAVAGDPSQIPAGSNLNFEQRLSIKSFVSRLSGEKIGDIAIERGLQILSELAQNQRDTYRRALTDVSRDVAELLNIVGWLLDPFAVVIDCPYAAVAAMEEEFYQAVEENLEKRTSLGRIPRFCPRLPNMEAQYFGAVKALEKYWIESME